MASAPLPTGMAGFEVDGGDVIKLLLQFLHEQGLSRSARELQKESGVALNTVDSRDRFAGDIRHGRWETVLPVVERMRLPPSLMMALYEQVTAELLECREVELAREMLRTAPPLQLLRSQEPQRFLALDNLAQKHASLDTVAAYSGGIGGVSGGMSSGGVAAEALQLLGGKDGKERRRAALAEGILPHTALAPPSRLLSLLGQGLKWQAHNGLLPRTGQFDLFQGAALIGSLGNSASMGGAVAAAMTRRARDVNDGEARCAKQRVGTVRFGSQCHPDSAAFSPEGASLLSGSSDGFVEVWDFETCKLRRDVSYQATPDDERFMMHDKPVYALAFSRDGEFLASGCQDGKIKVWRLRTGKRIKLFERAHTAGVTSIAFSGDGLQVLSGSFDETARVHGLKSGRMLKEFRGHSSFVNAVAYTQGAKNHAGAGRTFRSSSASLHQSDASDLPSATDTELDLAELQDGAELGLGDRARAVSASSDGTVKVWEVRSSACLATFRLGAQASDVAVHTIIPLPHQASAQIARAARVSWSPKQDGALLLVANRSNTAFVTTLGGQVVRTFTSSGYDVSTTTGADTTATGAKLSHQQQEQQQQQQMRTSIMNDFVAAVLSPRGRWAYCGAEDGRVFCFDLTHADGAKLDHVFYAVNDPEAATSASSQSSKKAARHQLLGFTHHPHRTLLATFADDGLLKLWQP